ncbi:MAG: nucleotidyltransferase [Fimbriimonadaceae bacterium]
MASSQGIGIDVGFAGFEYEKVAIERSVLSDYGKGVKLRVISAEDLVVMKAFAGRDQDWADVGGVARRQGEELDWDYIQRTLKMLAEVTEENTMVLRALSYRDP